MEAVACQMGPCLDVYPPPGRVGRSYEQRGTSNHQLAGWQCLEERDGSGDLVARFTYAPGYIDAVAVQERDLNSDDDFGDTNEIVYYHANTLFSVYALSDANGTMVERYRYDAYGAATVLDPDGSVDVDGLSDVLNPYVFTGRRVDLETGNGQPSTALLQYRNRYYAPTLGRFTSSDPLGYSERAALYAYAAGRATWGLDPMGLEEQEPEQVEIIRKDFGPFPSSESIAAVEKAMKDAHVQQEEIDKTIAAMKNDQARNPAFVLTVEVPRGQPAVLKAPGPWLDEIWGEYEGCLFDCTVKRTLKQTTSVIVELIGLWACLELSGIAGAATGPAAPFVTPATFVVCFGVVTGVSIRGFKSAQEDYVDCTNECWKKYAEEMRKRGQGPVPR